MRGFPGDSMVKNSPTNSVDTGLISGLRTKIPHAAEQLSTCATTIELVLGSLGATTPEALAP